MDFNSNYMNKQTISLTLTEDEMQAISVYAFEEAFTENARIFSEGDPATSFYIIESGQVAICVNKSGKPEQISQFAAGDFFGELALLDKNNRESTAITISETVLWTLSQDEFSRLLAAQPLLGNKLKFAAQSRREELLLKEQLVTVTGLGQQNLHVSLKGDPSLRETAFTRERYESVVDKVLPKLIPALHKLLFDTSVFRIFVGLNNGEVRINSAINPFIEEVHTADKIVADNYISRHFPPMDYRVKCKLMYDTTDFIEGTSEFNSLPADWRNVLDVIQDDWRPIARQQLEIVLGKLADMRKIQNFYLRNFSLSVAQDAIRMQFNCDGTHIVSSADYLQFIENNIPLE